MSDDVFDERTAGVVEILSGGDEPPEMAVTSES